MAELLSSGSPHLVAAMAEAEQRVYLAENAKKCGNDKFKAGKHADALDWYDQGISEVDVLMAHVATLTRASAAGTLKLNKKSRKLVKTANTLHAALHSNRCKALCKVGRWEDARAAAATVRAVSPDHEGSIKAGAHAALGARDAGASEWDLLRNFALTHPDDAEAQDLAAAWEELSGGVAPALAVP